MPTRRSSLVAALLAAAAGAAEANEQTVTIETSGQNMTGTLALPEGAPAPVVLLLHGFTGARDELATEHVEAGVFAHTAARLLDAGYASLRIDFRGSGDSTADLQFADTTFETQIGDALGALEYLSDLDSVDSEDIHIIGWSQGGLVAATAAGRSDAVDTLSLWNAVGEPQVTYGSIFGPDIMEAGMAAAADEVIDVTLPWGVDVSLKGGFFDGIETLDPIDEIKGYSGALFVAVGTEDTTVPPVSGEKFIGAHEGPEQLWSAEMDHVFNIFATDETLDQLIAETIAFIEAHDD